MLILGVNDRAKKIDEGEFQCPHCQGKRPYALKETRLWFSLFFIPLIPLGGPRGAFIECQDCFRPFATDVLNSKPITAIELHAQDVKADLRSGTPLEMVRQKLINAGYAAEFAEDVIASAANRPLGRCHSCNLSYDASISHCSMCGNPVH